MINIKEYFAYIKSTPLLAPRLLLIPDIQTWVSLQDYYLQNATQLNFSELLMDDAILPDMSEALFFLEEKLETNSEPLLINGMGPGLFILADEPFEQAVYQLLRWLEKGDGKNVVFMLPATQQFQEAMKKYSGLHRLISKWRVIIFAAANSNILQACYQVKLLDEDLASFFSVRKGTIADWIKHNAAPHLPLEQPWHILVPHGKIPLAGIRQGIEQIYSLKQAVAQTYGHHVNMLSDQALHWLAEFSASSENSPKSDLLKHFCDNGNVTQNILEIWLKSSETEQEILWWLLPGISPGNSYLHAVINLPDIDFKNFIQEYIQGFRYLNFKPAWANERYLALRYADIEKFKSEIEIAIFNSRSDPAEKIVPWLNGHTFEERSELLRRCAENGTIDSGILEYYPELKHYLDDGQFYPNDTLNEYFSSYRKLVVLNGLTEKFINDLHRFQMNIMDLPARDAILQRYSNDKSYALLVVDALGAAWLPMLMNMAHSNGLRIDMAEIGRSILPTITNCNAIIWPDERRLNDIKFLDNLAHHGVETHEQRSPEETFAAMLEMPGKLYVEIRKALNKYKHVILTGDHGMSRLAALALESQGFAAPIRIDAIPAGLRYCEAPIREALPNNLISSLDGSYLCIKNYDYFPKSGNRGFALHGGASLEEWLVPVIIFSNSTMVTNINSQLSSSATQIIEDPDFDI